jgi:acetyltransferase-like isoleucine patch superfamily enzyme
LHDVPPATGKTPYKTDATSTIISMSLWIFLDGGLNMPGVATRGQRLTLWIGRKLALRHRQVTAPRSCRLHPGARINPRDGKISFGENCSVATGAVIQGNVSLGDHCSIQTNSILIGYGTAAQPDGKITLGNHVRIAPNVMMFGGDHIFDNPDVPIHRQGHRLAPIIIGDDVWIAGRAMITAGVTIGRGSVIGAGAVVTRDIPPFSIAVGCPARVIGVRGKAKPPSESP